MKHTDLINAGEAELENYTGRFRPRAEAEKVVDAVLQVMHDTITLEANLLHQKIYGAGTYHSTFHSCGCWHQAVVTTWGEIELETFGI